MKIFHRNTIPVGIGFLLEKMFNKDILKLQPGYGYCCALLKQA